MPAFMRDVQRVLLDGLRAALLLKLPSDAFTAALPGPRRNSLTQFAGNRGL